MPVIPKNGDGFSWNRHPGQQSPIPAKKGGRFLLEPSPGAAKPNPGNSAEEVNIHLTGIAPCDRNIHTGGRFQEKPSPFFSYYTSATGVSSCVSRSEAGTPGTDLYPLGGRLSRNRHPGRNVSARDYQCLSEIENNRKKSKIALIRYYPVSG